MPRPKIDNYWIDATQTIIENEPRLGPGAIFVRLQQLGARMGRADYPSERKINQIKHDYPGPLPGERREHHYFHWPESMGEEEGSLPWEAAGAALELVSWLGQPGSVPTRLVKWYWRATLAAPNASRVERFTVAARLAVQEAIGMDVSVNRRMEALLAFLPWRSNEANDAYLDSLRRQGLEPAEGWPHVPGDVVQGTLGFLMPDAAGFADWWKRMEELGLIVSAKPLPTPASLRPEQLMMEARIRGDALARFARNSWKPKKRTERT